MITLNLRGNRLKTLPEFIGQLTQLSRLNLADNQLKSLPEPIGRLTQLKTVKLHGNRFPILEETYQLPPQQLISLICST